MAFGKRALQHGAECQDELAASLACNGHLDGDEAGWKRSVDAGDDHCASLGMYTPLCSHPDITQV